MKSPSEVPSPFIEGTNVQWAWDSISMGNLKECARKYYYTHVLGYQPKGERLHLKYGIIVHGALEYYDVVKAQGADHEEALDAAVHKALIDTWVYPEGFDPKEADLAYLDSDEDVGHPWETGHDKKTRETLIRTVVWYLEHFKDDPAQTVILSNGKPAVELEGKLNMNFSYEGVEFLYGYHLDRVVTYADATYVMDRKTTGSTPGAYYFKQFSPDNQMSGYAFVSKIDYGAPVQGIMIDAIQIAVGFTAFARSITTRSDSQLDEWFHDIHHWFNLAIFYAEQNYWPMNDKACHKFDGCQFREVCAAAPGVRDSFLKTYFEVNHWNPLAPRT